MPMNEQVGWLLSPFRGSPDQLREFQGAQAAGDAIAWKRHQSSMGDLLRG